MKKEEIGRSENSASLDPKEASRFDAALLLMRTDASSCGVGTLSEKLVHRALKFFEEPNEEHHEIEVLGSIADIKNSGGITEIQTRAFEKLRGKLSRFLPEYPVTLVHPLINAIYVNYVDEKTGEVVRQRKSTRRDTLNRAACELYKIADLLPHPNLCVKIVFLDLCDVRPEGVKRAWTKSKIIERAPCALKSTLTLREVSDYRAFLPEGLEGTFTASELGKKIRLDSRRTHNTLSLLLSLGIIERVGKEGRAFLYKAVK